MPPSLQDTVTDSVLERNRAWLQLLFRSYGALSMPLRVPREMRGHTYIFERPVLNTRLGEHIAAPVDAGLGPLCGDNGGRTAKGAPCRRKAVAAGGRCRQHPHVSVVPHVAVGERVSRADVCFGDDAAIRPIGGGVAWSACRITVPGIDAVLAPIDLLEAEPLVLTTCTRVWDEQIFKIRSILRAPCEAAIVLGGAELPVEPAWTTEMLLDRHPVLAGCCINGHVPAPGWLLRDYGVVPGAAVPAEKKPG